MAVLGQEGASTVAPPCWDEGGDALDLPLMQNQGARGGQQILTCPVGQIQLRGKVLLDAFQIGGDQIARNVVAVEGTFHAVTDRAAQAELGPREIDDRQYRRGHM
jgi:hypothetical protein